MRVAHRGRGRCPRAHSATGVHGHSATSALEPTAASAARLRSSTAWVRTPRHEYGRIWGDLGSLTAGFRQGQASLATRPAAKCSYSKPTHGGLVVYRCIYMGVPMGRTKRTSAPTCGMPRACRGVPWRRTPAAHRLQPHPHLRWGLVVGRCFLLVDRVVFRFVPCRVRFSAKAPKARACSRSLAATIFRLQIHAKGRSPRASD